MVDGFHNAAAAYLATSTTASTSLVAGNAARPAEKRPSAIQATLAPLSADVPAKTPAN